MKNILLLGPGTSRARFHEPDRLFGDQPDEKITVLDRDPEMLRFWEPYADMVMLDDLRDPVLCLPNSGYDEVHAYEVLNLLPGDEVAFFSLWRKLYDTMRHGARLYGITPHFRSQWIHAYPTPQRVYTPGLLFYLDRDSDISAKEQGFRDLWPEPYCLRSVGTWDQVILGEPIGFHFILEKP